MYCGQVRGASLEFGFGRDTTDTGVERVRGRVSLETDGHSHIGRDVLIAALLVAKSFGFETAPLADIVNILMMAAEMGRVLMAKAGFRSVDEPIGHTKDSGEESTSRDGSLLLSPKLLPAHHLPRVLGVSRKM